MNSSSYHNDMIHKVKGILLSKALTCMKYFLKNENGYVTKETDTFGYSDILTIYTFHTDHITPQHTAFEYSAACLSFVCELLPGLIPFAIL